MTCCFLPEGRLLHTPENIAACARPEALSQAMAAGTVLEGSALLCDENHDLLVSLGPFTGRIPRVGKPVSFTVEALEEKDGRLCPLLSRRKAQELALASILDSWTPGMVVPATVTHLEGFGAFVDIGCGVASMIGVERLSISRIAHPGDRLRVGQDIYAAVLEVDRHSRRVILTHRELLGTWEENAALFKPGMTVPGHVRGIKDYGDFVELTANLSGLAETKEGVREGDRVSVYIKSIIPQRMKLKLLIIDVLPPAPGPEEPRYFLPQGKLTRWEYAPPGCRKAGGETVFAGQ